MSKKRSRLVLLCGLAVAFLLFVAAYLSSPFLALSGLAAAAKSGDRDALEAKIDFPSVRESLKAQISARALSSVNKETSAANPFAALGALLLPAITDRIVDSVVTPEGISTVIKNGKLELHPEQASSVSDTGSRPATYRMGYTTLNRFKAGVRTTTNDGDGLTLVLERRGLFSWKLIRIDLPSPTSVTPSKSDQQAGSTQETTTTSPPPAAAVASADFHPASFSEDLAFSDFAVTPYQGATVPPDYSTNPGAKNFRTRIADGVKGGPTFGGSMALIPFGCGAGCSSGYVVDLQTGDIFDVPAGGEELGSGVDWSQRVDSRLLKGQWSGSAGGCTRAYYLLEDHAFRLLKRLQAEGSTCPDWIA